MSIWRGRTDSIWVIVEKSTGKFYKCRSGKCGWEKSVHARSAFKLCTGIDFDDQDLFRLVSLALVNSDI